MANRHQSAIRQHRRSLRARARNRRNQSRLRTQLKTIRQLIDDKKQAEANDMLRATLSLIDHSVTKGTIHRNAASRTKSRITRRIQALAAKA